MKVVFMGTPDFAVPALERLIKEHEVVCVYTREPKLSGRGNKLNKTPVHLVAEANGIEVRTPKTLRNAEEQQKFAALKADVAVVAAYGLILPLPVLEAYPFGCLNLHASLLPRWRGAAPIQRAVEAGDAESGVTVMQVAEGLDTGDMLLKGKVEITSSTTGGELHDKLALLGADLISRVLADIKSFTPQPQPQDGACYAAKIDKAECKLDFNQKAEVLCRKIRAFNPYPAMFFEYGGERFKVLEAHKVEKYAPAGTIIEDNNCLQIACADGALNITQIQRQGKKLMTIGELLRGFHFAENSKAE
ncbi:MAG: methionyl-tRNA formyltransferase [Alphaproteobacteria bacterium]|nr:methionyl-tRNA formyltransferase [Alphaproteobacteria bacterium]